MDVGTYLIARERLQCGVTRDADKVFGWKVGVVGGRREEQMALYDCAWAIAVTL